ncbi:amidohydrolase family protein [Mycobacterium syngnathidarum]
MGFRGGDGNACAAADLLGAVRQVPRLQMIVGHLGEMLPFAAYRIDRYYGLGGDADASRRLQRLPSEYLRTNFHITTSGNFCPSAFRCTLDVIGADRVMFSVDYPMDDNLAGARFLSEYPMDDPTRRKVSSENAIGLFGDRLPAHLGA